MGRWSDAQLASVMRKLLTNPDNEIATNGAPTDMALLVNGHADLTANEAAVVLEVCGRG